MIKMKLKNKGQSTVEYVLLMFVIVAIISAVFSNKKFKDFFGKDSSFFMALKNRMEYSYRYGMSGVKDESPGGNYADKHDTYYNTKQSDTHFFAPTTKY